MVYNHVFFSASTQPRKMIKLQADCRLPDIMRMRTDKLAWLARHHRRPWWTLHSWRVGTGKTGRIKSIIDYQYVATLVVDFLSAYVSDFKVG